ncbi:MAG: BNR repeat-containing protein [Mediterranea sp.]|jgi:hypothetical protein|nr:BNR repeat-containing protein [Mediterranea sp.]
MKKTLSCCAFLALALCPLAAQRLVEVGTGFSQTSVNTAVFRHHALVTHGDKQYIAYYDADGYMVLGRRQLANKRWTLERTAHRGKVSDAHNVISLGVDGDGYVHVAFDHHGDPLNYCRGVAPGSLTLGEKREMVGSDENDVTYPQFYEMPDGSLLFAYRDGASGQGNLVLNRYEPATRKWQRMHDVLVDGERQRNAYWQLCVDRQGTLHLSWVWRETPSVETNHDLCYARSRDGGRSWERADGTPYQLPINAANAEYAFRIPQGSELINQTGMAADERGCPYIATYWRDADSDIPQYRLVWHDGNAWQCRQVGQRTSPFSLSGVGTKRIPIARPAIAVDGDKVYYLFRDEERGSRVSMATTDCPERRQWTVTDLTAFAVNAWEPVYDEELWRQRRQLHLFIQNTEQGDGERSVAAKPSPVFVLEAVK